MRRACLSVIATLLTLGLTACQGPKVIPASEATPLPPTSEELYDDAQELLDDVIGHPTLPPEIDKLGLPPLETLTPDEVAQAEGRGGFGLTVEDLVGTPTDVSFDLATSFPKPNSVLDFTAIPMGWFRFKEMLNKRIGLKLAVSYQGIYARASETRTGDDVAASGWFLFEGAWSLVCRDGPYEGGLVFSIDERHLYGNAQDPSLFGVGDVGSLWATEPFFFEWDLWTPFLFWQQKLGERLTIRAGNMVGITMIDFFRFKDSRTAFSGTPLTAPLGSMPWAGPGLGFFFEWEPTCDPDFYVSGTVNDLNFKLEEIDWSTAFEYGQFFYALEVGKFWRSPTDARTFDHLHLTLFYADEKDTLSPVFPNKAGGGFKIAGEKQCGPWVGFGSYTYNTAEGGAFGATWLEHTVTAGVAYKQPLGIRGEVALGATWAKPIDGLGGAPFLADLDDQWGLEAYWKLLMTKDLWITPGAQFIWDPSLNPDADQITIAQIKFRLFL